MAAAMLSSPRHLLSLVFRGVSRFSNLNSSIEYRQRLPLSYSVLNKSARCLSTESPKIQTQPKNSSNRRRTTVSSSGNINQQHRVDRALYKLDVEVRKTGRINLRDVREIFNEIKTAGVASATHSLLIIRCCGTLLPEELPADRTALVSDIWRTLQDLNVQLDVSHYNALLKVHSENEHEFTPTDFLADMEAKGVAPNRVTYQRLIAYYCQRGNIAGASKILDFMKEKDLPINENVFNSLVTGHARSNDLENAKSIFDVMRNAKLEPSADTYTQLMCGYAEKGDMDGLRAAIKDAENRDIFLLDRDYMSVVVALSSGNHVEHVDEILGKMRKMVGYNQDAINTILQLVNISQEDAAYKLLLTMPRSLPDASNSPAPVGQFFIRQLVKVGRPIEKVVQFCDDLKRRSLNNVGLVRATEVSLFVERTDYAETFLRKMKEQGFPLRSHYFWPLMATYHKRSSEEDVLRTVRLMLELDVPANFDTFVDYVFPAIALRDTKSVVEKMKEFGYTVGTVVSPLVTRLVMERQLRDAAELVRSYPVRLSAVALLRALPLAYQETDDLDSTLEILAKLDESREPNQRADWTGSFVVDYVRGGGSERLDKLDSVLNGLKSKNLGISHASAETLHRKMESIGGFSRIVPLLEELTTSSLEGIAEDADSAAAANLPHPRDMSLEDLEHHYTELKAKGMNTRGILRRLLFQYCRFKNLQRAMEIKAELDACDFIYTPAMYAQLMELHVSHQMLDEALDYRRQMLATEPNFAVDDHKILNLAQLLVKHGKIQDALSLVRDHHAAHGAREPPETLSGNVWRLLNAAAAADDAQAARNFFDLLVGCGYTTPTNVVLGPLVKCHLRSGDVDGAVAEFERCCRQYRCTPLKNEIFVKLIEAEDAEKLQNVVNLSTEIHGEMNTMYDLAFAFVDCNQVRQARKILETPGMRARHQRLDSACDKYIAENQVANVEHLVAISRDVFGVDRDRMYFHLLRAHVKGGNVDAALGVWTSMQEESVQPRARTLVTLADFLRRHGRPVPFEVPDESGADAELVGGGDVEPFDADVQQLTRAVQDEDVDRALDQKRMLEDGGRELTVAQVSSVVDLLLRKGRLNEALSVTKERMARGSALPHQRTLRALVMRLSHAGDVESLTHLDAHLTDGAKRNLRFNGWLAKALIAGGRHLEFLESLENAAVSKDNVPSGAGIFALLQNRPELRDRVERLATHYARQDVHLPLNMLWMHHVVEGNYDRADEVFQATPYFQERLLFMNVLRTAEERDDVTMMRRLVDTVKGTRISARSKGLAYSGLIDLYNSRQDLDAALAAFDEATSSSPGLAVPDFNAASLARLGRSLESQGRTVPFEVRRTVEVETSSTSSSDSSDDDHDGSEPK